MIGDIHRVMMGKKEGCAGIGAAARIQQEFEMGYSQVKQNLLERERQNQNGNFPLMPFFANTGIIPTGSLDFEAKIVHAFIAPPVEYPPGIGLAVSTFRDELTLSTGFLNSPFWRGIAGSICRNMEQRLSLL